MKITIDIPDTTLCASVTLVYFAKSGMSMMRTTMIDTNDLRTKSEIKIKGDEQTEQGEC